MAKKKVLDFQTLPHLSKRSRIYDFFSGKFFYDPRKYVTLDFSRLSENHF